MAGVGAAELLARVPHSEPRFLFPVHRGQAVDDAVAGAFLDELDVQDRAIVVLVSGLGLDLGGTAHALNLDPSIVWWRLRRAFLGGARRIGADPDALERGVTRLLRTPAPGGGDADAAHRAASGSADGSAAPPTVAALRFAAFPPEVFERLGARLASRGGDLDARERTPGLGVGSLALILLAVAGFMVYGAIRDENPLWRAMSLVRQADYPKARSALQELGDLPEGRAWIAITWLAEGEFERALALLAEPGVSRYFGEFRPMDAPLREIEADPRSRALLPRGLVAHPRPEFVYRNAPEGGTLQLTVTSQSDPSSRPRALRHPLPPPVAGEDVTVLEYPQNWPPLADSVIVWDVEEGESAPTSFTVLPREVRRELQQKAAARLTHEVPQSASEFLRAHYDLRNGLLEQAARRFAVLATDFPDQDYPRRMLAEVSAALGVDPQVFLR